MCVYILQNNLESPFRFYLLLKLTHPSGKIRYKEHEIKYFASLMNVTTKTIKSYFKKLLELNWLRLNLKTKYYQILSIDRLRKNNEWLSRASIEMHFEDIYRIRAILGAAIYGYLHKDFWRKVKRERVVRIKGRTYHTLSSSFNYTKLQAPISIYGAHKLFNISIAKLSRLKTLSSKEGLIIVTKQYLKHDIDKHNALMIKKYHPEQTRNLVFKNGKYYLQQIDLILPRIDIRRRKKLEP